ncbi:hypothetical protein B7P43_G15002 [Cryptotermes secundus]|uniref:Uncharacterized protein n=1 Tax=Cryptotermes secundus TaxID=105785 RepID=A0A2J7Q6P1_9NEOP|nr:hypothetical protein B7P43_G15002 [Cryptotermes secundus]
MVQINYNLKYQINKIQQQNNEEVAVLSDGGCGTQVTASMKVLPHAPLMDMLDFTSGKDFPGRSPVASTRRAWNVGN